MNIPGFFRVLSFLAVSSGITLVQAQGIREPKITAITMTQLRDVGETVNLACSVRDADDLTVYWLKLPSHKDGQTPPKVISANGDLLLPDPRLTVQSFKNFNSIQIKDLDSSDIGDYQCYLTANMTRTVSLFIRSPPAFVDNSTETTAIELKEGGTANLSCLAVGYPVPKVYWSRDKNFTPQQTKIEGPVISLTDIRKEDRGLYYCLAKNTLGEIRRGISLEVFYPPIILDNSTTSLVLLEGDTATLSCHASGFPPPMVYWSRDEDFTAEQTRVIGSSVSITNIKRQGKGRYYCLAKNIMGEARRKIDLDVLFPPTILDTSPRTVGVSEHGTAVLDCSAEGNPQPQVYWSRRKNFTAEESSVFGSVINITHVAKSGRGRYYCLAQNSLGEARYSINVEVEFAPKVTVSTTITSRVLGAQMVFECGVIGFPFPNITWIKNQTSLAGDPHYKINNKISDDDSGSLVNATLTIDSIEERDFGLYKCKAENVLGTDFAAIRLLEAELFGYTNTRFTVPKIPNPNETETVTTTQQPDVLPLQTVRTTVASYTSTYAPQTSTILPQTSTIVPETSTIVPVVPTTTIPRIIEPSQPKNEPKATIAITLVAAKKDPAVPAPKRSAFEEVEARFAAALLAEQEAKAKAEALAQERRAYELHLEEKGIIVTTESSLATTDSYSSI